MDEEIIMKDYILIPNYIDIVKDIYSQNLEDFFQEVEIIDRKIPLDYIRKLYIQNKVLFFKIIDELSLRGFQFFSEKTNNILPTFKPDFSRYIRVSENQHKFQNIKFQLYGLSGFTQRFMVENDLFFHQIPLQGFHYINASVNLTELENEFRMAGFDIHENEDNHELDSSNVPTLMFEKSPNNSTEPVDPPKEETATSLPIEVVFSDNIYNSFKKFCSQENLEDLNDIKESHLDQYKEMKGVGTYKFNKVREALAQYKSGEKVIAPEEPQSNHYSLPDFNQFALQVPISKAFYGRTFTKWMNYCKQNTIETIGDLSAEHIEDFSHMSGIGKKKVDQVIEVLEEVDKETKESSLNVFTSGFIFPYIKDHQLSDLFTIFQIDISIVPSIKLSDIEGKPLSEIDPNVDYLKFFDLSQKLQNLVDPKEIFSNIKSDMTERDNQILQNRFVEGKTLEETGKVVSVTRERVRQIEKKFVAKVEQYLDSKQFLLLLTFMFPDKKFISTTVFVELVGDENADIIELLKYHPDLLNYLSDIDAFFFSMEKKSEFVKMMDDFLEELPDIFKFSEYQSRMQEFYHFDSHINFESIFKSYGLIHYGKFYSRYKLRITHVLDLIFKYYISGPLKLDVAGTEHIRQLAQKHFNYQLSDSDRSVDARLRDSKQVLLVDKNTFQWFDPESIDPSLIDHISDVFKRAFH